MAFAKANNISILGLFCWEQRMGQWHALYQYEQDVAIEEFCPFNNKGLLLSISLFLRRKEVNITLG